MQAHLVPQSQCIPEGVVVLRAPRRRSGGVDTTPFFWELKLRSLGAFATDATGQLDILGHDGHTLGVDGSQVGVLKEADQVGFSSLLKGQHSAALETQVGLEVLGDLTNQSLEGQLPDQELSALLVLPAVATGGVETGGLCLRA